MVRSTYLVRSRLADLQISNLWTPVPTTPIAMGCQTGGSLSMAWTLPILGMRYSMVTSMAFDSMKVEIWTVGGQIWKSTVT